MNWTQLTEIDQLDTIKSESANQPIMIFKHSTSCSISGMSLNRLERSWNDADVPDLKIYFLDLLNYRHVSNAVAETFGVRHESPQLLIISEGKAVYDNSHSGIAYHEVKRIYDDFQAA